MFKLILASILAFSALAAEEASKTSQAIDKAIEAQMAGPTKAYDAYQKALEEANKKVVASLEKMKADLNDVKKGNMSLTERAKAIEEVDAKIDEVKKGLLNDVVTARTGKDFLLGNGLADASNAIVGKWKVTHNDGHNKVITINDDLSGSVVSSTWGQVNTNFTVVYDRKVKKWYVIGIDHNSSEVYYLEKNVMKCVRYDNKIFSGDYGAKGVIYDMSPVK